MLDYAFDLSHFDARFRNDVTGALAYPAAVLPKVVLFADSQGVVRSRAIERVCQEHVTFMAHFISTLRDDIAQVFAAVLAACDGQRLIGRAMFAIDGVKLPSNASTHRSGTRGEFTQRAETLETAAQVMLDRHRAKDALGLEATSTTPRGPRSSEDLGDAPQTEFALMRSHQKQSCDVAGGGINASADLQRHQ